MFHTSTKEKIKKNIFILLSRRGEDTKTLIKREVFLECNVLLIYSYEEFRRYCGARILQFPYTFKQFIN